MSNGIEKCVLRLDKPLACNSYIGPILFDATLHIKRSGPKYKL